MSSASSKLKWGIFLLPVRMRAAFYRMTTPVWFRKLGKGASVFGTLRFAFPFTDIRIGRNAMLGHETFWQANGGASISIGDNFSFNRHSLMVIGYGLSIGDNVAIGEMTSIRDQDHAHSTEDGVWDQGYKGSPIVIEDNVWIGRGCYIGPGTVIGRGSIVAANSTVRGVFPPNVLIAGVPGVVKKELSS